MFNIDHKKYNKPAFFIQVLFMIFVIIVAGQLINLQIIDADNLKDRAKQMRQMTKGVILRGEIVDRNGIKLASDTTLYDIYAHPRYYKKNMSTEKIAELISPILQIDRWILSKELNKLNKSTITIVKDIDRETALELKKLNIKGLDIVKKSERLYPQGKLAAHILGYVNAEANIFAGVENTALSKL
ncbi:MAG: hypothetical protein PHV68_07725, partial [Candidatus Gastranaerophilales bacterium]|nr:hypothetical protein [Candidatus Gastranaerophilales bacterium]